MGSHLSAINAINPLVHQGNSAGASSRVVNAIQKAADKTGVNFSYLMQKASQESSFDPSAKATTSTATGLFQFTSQTWLHMIKTYGHEHGLGNYAAQINVDSDGHLSVANAGARQAILGLRKDPEISAQMAGEFDKENAAVLARKVGGKIGATELYLAHFLGATGASNFIREMRASPNTAAADVLPTAAEANNSVFYTKTGEARSLKQVYQRFAQKFENHSTRLASLAAPAPRAPAVASSSTVCWDSASPATYVAPDTRVAPSDAGGTRIASASSTLLDAMIFGQVQELKFDSVITPSFDRKRDEGGSFGMA